MSRIRTVKPELFRHESLFDAEITTGLPLRLAFVGMFTVADCEGRFAWKPRTIKLDVLPHDTVDFSAVLDSLERYGFIQSYTVSGVRYGWIPSFKKHQQIPTREVERGSNLPPMPSNSDENHEVITEHVPVHAEACSEHEPVHVEACTGIPGREGNRKGKGIGREGNSAQARNAPARKTDFPADLAITPELQAWADRHGYSEPLAAHLSSFRDKAVAKGYQYADWTAALRNAIRDDWAGLRKPQDAKRAAQGGGRNPAMPGFASNPNAGEFAAIMSGGSIAPGKSIVIEGELAHVAH